MEEAEDIFIISIKDRSKETLGACRTNKGTTVISITKPKETESFVCLSDKPIESCHGKLRFFERKSNHICRKNLVGRYKDIRTKASFNTFNAKKLRSIVKNKVKKKRLRYFQC